MAVGLPVAPDASPGHSPAQSSPPVTSWVPRPQSIWASSTWKLIFMYHRLGLIVSGLEDTPHGAILHRPIMLAYAFHDLWASAATAMFSFLAEVWTSSRYVLFRFSSPSHLRCCNWPPSGTTSPGWAGGFQNEWGTAGIKQVI